MCMRLLNAVIDPLGLASAKGAIRRTLCCSLPIAALTTAHDASGPLKRQASRPRPTRNPDTGTGALVHNLGEQVG